MRYAFGYELLSCSRRGCKMKLLACNPRPRLDPQAPDAPRAACGASAVRRRAR